MLGLHHEVRDCATPAYFAAEDGPELVYSDF
jgi:hypothetical protein